MFIDNDQYIFIYVFMRNVTYPELFVYIKNSAFQQYVILFYFLKFFIQDPTVCFYQPY